MTDETSGTRFLDLPVDVLYLIFPHLDVPTFIALTSTCKALHQPALSQYAHYWSSETRSTFRVPNQPVAENDGARWQKMYKRLLTQSKVYTWGSNEMGCLGHSQVTPAQLNSLPPAERNRLFRLSKQASWPTVMTNTNDIGIVADMQCGGWSTTLLSSKGALYTVGVLNALAPHLGRPMQNPRANAHALRYPPGFTPPNQRYDSVTAVKQFSSGRCHILAVSDSGRIWSWGDIEHAAYNVKFLNIELRENARSDQVGHVRKVFAGWNKSSALIDGTGIVLWDPLEREPGAQESEDDAALVLESAVVPSTGFRRRGTQVSNTQDSERIGEVVNYICLEDHVIFCTHLGKVFAGVIEWNDDRQSISTPIEIALPNNGSPLEDGEQIFPPFATDVQGSFRSFAVFTRSGAVLVGNADLLRSPDFGHPSRSPALKRYPALQNTGVISLAFGDYHYHALHASGQITSYGHEPRGCGALGLGGHGDPEGRLRGLRYQALNRDARLVPHAYVTGRQVWFEPEKQPWITYITSGGVDPMEARERIRMCENTNIQGEVSEWIEQEGRAWQEKFGGNTDLDDDGLGAYFAHTIAAAGSHSGAIVLVNEELASKIRSNCFARAAGPEVESGHGAEEAVVEQQSPATDRTLLAQAATYATDLGRWAFGLAASTASAGSAASVPFHRDPNNPHAFNNPSNHGAAAADGSPYAWANDSFPRLRLTDGRVMPGTVEISEWRHGRPEWDLSVEF